MKTLRLEKKIPIECYLIQANVSFPDMSYLLPVLVHVNDHKNGATAASLAEDLFLSGDAMGRNLLNICLREKLITEKTSFVHSKLEKIKSISYFMTEKGRLAIHDERVFVKSPNSMWKIYCAESHPFIPDKSRVLCIEKADPYTASSNRAGKYPIDEIENYILEFQSKTMTAPFTNNCTDFCFDSISTYAKEHTLDREFVLVWNFDRDSSCATLQAVPDGKSSTLHQNIPKKKLMVDWPMKDYLPDITTYGKAMSAIFDNLGGHYDWDDEYDCIRVPFNQATSEERINLHKTIELDNPEIDDHTFESITTTVDVLPKHGDEYEWAHYLLVKKLEKLVTPSMFDKWKSDIQKRLSSEDVNFRQSIEEYFMTSTKEQFVKSTEERFVKPRYRL